MKNWLFIIVVVLLTAACSSDRKPQNENREPAVCFDNWDRLEEKLAYFKELIDLQDSAMAGYEISIHHLQSLMPQSEVDFHVFMATEPYSVVEVEGEKSEHNRALYLIAGEMAVADTLDMMSQYLKWFNWSDGWVSETLWDKAVEIEKRHREKFHRLMQSSERYEAWQEYRNELLEYEKESN